MAALLHGAMQLINFQVVENRWNIEISALDKVWNLHDALYLGLRHSFAHDADGFITGNQVELSWQVPLERYAVSGFSLVFNDVDFLRSRREMQKWRWEKTLACLPSPKSLRPR